jgi:hypothetical protein
MLLNMFRAPLFPSSRALSMHLQQEQRAQTNSLRIKFKISHSKYFSFLEPCGEYRGVPAKRAGCTFKPKQISTTHLV